jgi:hypothetical protein
VYPSQNLAQFGYRIWDEGFKNGYNFNFTVTFKVKNPGTLKTTASVIEFDSASEDAQVDVADFRITVTPSDTTVILNKGDEINFNIFVINYGGTFYPDPYEGYRFVGINFRYNSNVLNYTGYTPCRTTDGNKYPQNYLVPKISPSENLAQFAYNVSDDVSVICTTSTLRSPSRYWNMELPKIPFQLHSILTFQKGLLLMQGLQT